MSWWNFSCFLNTVSDGARLHPVTRRQRAVGSRAAEWPLPFPGAVVRTRVYVDGFNLYYGALKGTRFKWLDPIRLAALLLLRGYRIDRLRYFTARVSGKPGRPGTPADLPEGAGDAS